MTWEHVETPRLWLLIWWQVSSTAEYGFVNSTIDKYWSSLLLLRKWYDCKGCTCIRVYICTKGCEGDAGMRKRYVLLLHFFHGVDRRNSDWLCPSFVYRYFVNSSSGYTSVGNHTAITLWSCKDHTMIIRQPFKDHLAITGDHAKTKTCEFSSQEISYFSTTDSKSIASFYRCDRIFDLQKDFWTPYYGTTLYVEKMFDLATDKKRLSWPVRSVWLSCARSLSTALIRLFERLISSNLGGPKATCRVW